ncbi:zinc finger protein 260 [Ixodes scapularis]
MGGPEQHALELLELRTSFTTLGHSSDPKDHPDFVPTAFNHASSSPGEAAAAAEQSNKRRVMSREGAASAALQCGKKDLGNEVARTQQLAVPLFSEAVPSLCQTLASGTNSAQPGTCPDNGRLSVLALQAILWAVQSRSPHHSRQLHVFTGSQGAVQECTRPTGQHGTVWELRLLCKALRSHGDQITVTRTSGNADIPNNEKVNGAARHLLRTFEFLQGCHRPPSPTHLIFLQTPWNAGMPHVSPGKRYSLPFSLQRNILSHLVTPGGN